MRTFSLLFRLACSTLAFSASAAYAAPAATPIDPLVASSVARLAIAEQVALAKWDTKGRVEDIAREAVVTDNAKRAAVAANLDPEWIGGFFRAQIEANKLQYSLLATWRRTGGAPMHEPVDLAKDIRPRLDALQVLFMHQLAGAAPLRLSENCSAQVAAAIANYAADHQWDINSVRVAALDRAMAGFCMTN